MLLFSSINWSCYRLIEMKITLALLIESLFTAFINLMPISELQILVCGHGNISCVYSNLFLGLCEFVTNACILSECVYFLLTLETINSLCLVYPNF